MCRFVDIVGNHSDILLWSLNCVKGKSFCDFFGVFFLHNSQI